MPGVPANGIYGTSAIRRRKHRHGLTSLMQGSETSSRKPADRGRPTYTWTRAALINYTRTIGSLAISRSKIEPGLSIGGGSGPAGHLAHQTARKGRCAFASKRRGSALSGLLNVRRRPALLPINVILGALIEAPHALSRAEEIRPSQKFAVGLDGL